MSTALKEKAAAATVDGAWHATADSKDMVTFFGKTKAGDEIVVGYGFWEPSTKTVVVHKESEDLPGVPEAIETLCGLLQEKLSASS